MSELAQLLASVRVFGVRHHSPRSAAVLAQVLERHRPELVLIEAPPETDALWGALTDPETEPPVAVLGYRTDGTPASSLWPFAAYSPEYVALRWAAAAGARVGFIDLPVGIVLAAQGPALPSAKKGKKRKGKAPEPEPVPVVAPEDRPDVHAEAVRARGVRSFEELWDSAFEIPEHDPDSFEAAMRAYAELVRAVWAHPHDRARDAWMAARIAEHVRAGTDPSRIVVVCGAAHAVAFAAGDISPEATLSLPEPVPIAATLIPFSFPRLSEQLGYGAGNRAPQFYQRAHDAGCDYRRAVLEVLVDFTDHLRLRGFAVSLSDTIEAYRLANTLSGLRERSAPGLDELRDAAIATLCRGESAHVDTILWPTVIGRKIGRVSQRVGRNSLQEEFWREVGQRKLPRADEPERFNLQLNNELQIGTSIFLHRLRISGVPYASFQGTRTVSGFRSEDEAAGGLDALTRARETWVAQWTPATEVSLVEAIVWGDTLEQVATRQLDERLHAAVSTGEAADVLLEATVAGSPVTVAAALLRCDSLASSDEDLPSLARACRALSGLASYGSSRQASRETLILLCARTFERAVLRLHHACQGDDEAIVPVLSALRALHEVATGQPLVDGDAWFRAARGVVTDYAVHPAASGLCCGLLYIAQVIDDTEVVQVVHQRLSDPSDPAQVARFLEGFLTVDAMVLTRSEPVVEALDAFLLSLPPDAFRATLPTLRRAFGQLGVTERRYLHETLLKVRRLRGSAQDARAILDGLDPEQMASLDAELASALTDLEELF
jgi:hypothetical protein